MTTIRTRVVRAISVGWAIFALGLVAAIFALLLGGRTELPLALGLVALAIAIAFALNLMLLVILWRREMRERKNLPEPIPTAGAPAYEQPAPM